MSLPQNKLNRFLNTLQGNTMRQRLSKNLDRRSMGASDKLMNTFLFLWWKHSQRDKKGLWYCVISNARLMHHTGLSLNTLKRAKAQLIREGYLVRLRRFGKNGTGERAPLYKPGPLMLQGLQGYPQIYDPLWKTMPKGLNGFR